MRTINVCRIIGGAPQGCVSRIRHLADCGKCYCSVFSDIPFTREEITTVFWPWQNILPCIACVNCRSDRCRRADRWRCVCGTPIVNRHCRPKRCIRRCVGRCSCAQRRSQIGVVDPIRIGCRGAVVCESLGCCDPCPDVFPGCPRRNCVGPRTVLHG